MRAWLELARVSNLPTCVSNVLVGAAIGGVTCEIAWPAVGIVAVAVMLLYVGGMALNDVVDYRIALRQRPRRRIPSGRIPLRTAAAAALACRAAGARPPAVVVLPPPARVGVIPVTTTSFPLGPPFLSASASREILALYLP